jgi:hypothetical protein
MAHTPLIVGCMTTPCRKRDARPSGRVVLTSSLSRTLYGQSHDMPTHKLTERDTAVEESIIVFLENA